MDFINTYNDAEILIDAANHLANVLRHSPAYPGALHPFTISIDGVNVDDENAAREAFFAFLCSILNRWYYDAARESGLKRYNAPYLILDANALEVETGKDE